LVQASLYTKDAKLKKKLLDDAADQVINFSTQVWDKDANLYRHAKFSDANNIMPHWSRANGWGIFAASEVLLHMPKNHKDYNKVLAIYKDHIDGIIKWQDAKTGFWHQILDDATSYEETSGTAIFTMAIARGINNGWLPKKKYEPVALKGWTALTTTFGPGGTVSNICVGTMSSETTEYYKGRPTVPDDSHGLLGVLFAGMEMDKLLQPKGGK
jgi:rhamnogalacturonyl hydrolase YesR